MVCPRCGKDNEPENQFCGRCGLEFAQVVETSPEAQADLQYCYRHPKEATRLSCGRCERPICTKCVVIGPAGPRCPECARQNVQITARGVLHDVKSSLRGITRMGPFTIYIWIILIGMVLGLVRGCFWNRGPVHRDDYEPPPVERSSPSPTPAFNERSIADGEKFRFPL